MLSRCGIIFLLLSVGSASLYFVYFSLGPKVPPPNACSSDGGYHNLLYQIRNRDMVHLNGSVYLDYTGSGLYRTSQMQGIFKEYEARLFKNPHSASDATEDAIDEVRNMILSHLGTNSNKYTMIFTASATASLRLVSETFPWGNNSVYMYTRDNHNSVLGMRGLATHYGAQFRSVDMDKLEGAGKRIAGTRVGRVNHLFAFPAEENFAGVKYPLELIEKFRRTDFGDKFSSSRGRWFTLLDAAAYLPTNPINLSLVKPDFLVMSFYKMFGFPNLGALVVKNNVIRSMRKIGFSGGTVVMATCENDYALLQPRAPARFEDGTVPFLSIIALKEGFNKLNDLGIDNIAKHTWCITRTLFKRLNELRHSTGRPAVKIYGNHRMQDPTKQGAIVTFNFVNSTGSYIGYNEVMQAAAKENINIRVGCFCNPGGCTRASNLNDDQVEEYYKQKTSCHDSIDIIAGVPLGAVRVSIGPYTTLEDIDVFMDFVKNNFVSS